MRMARVSPRLPIVRDALVRRRLDELLASRDPEAAIARDPLGLVRPFAAPADREIVGLVAAMLAFGNVVAIRKSVARVLAVLGPSPARTVDAATERELAGKLRGFAHRVYRGPDVARMLANAGALRRAHGSLGDAFARELTIADREHPEDEAFREGLARFSDALRGGPSTPKVSPGLRHLVPCPRAGSACKRTLLYLRWMARPADGVDLGQWPVPASRLLLPLDTHVFRIAQNLGLTTRNTASWRASEEITAALRAFDPNDPVKYDFAICHLGVSRDCPSRRDPVLCDRCVLRTACLRWSA